MGDSHSVDKSAPPGGEILMIQDTGCCVQPGFSAPKPQCLGAVSSNDWEVFHNSVADAASKMWSEKSSLYLLVLLPFLIAPQLLPFGDAEGMAMIIQIGLTIAFFGLFLGPRFFTIQANETQDRVVQKACQDLASSSGASVEYRTAWVGFCKPKHAQPFRAIAIAPAGNPVGMPGMPSATAGQMMSVQVPPGAGPGTVLQVQSPAGQTVQVTVPPGVAEGQTFQVQTPAAPPVVVAATVVTPTVVAATVVQENNP